MDMLELKGMEISSRIDEIEREIKWYDRNDSCNSWECEQLESELREKESELRSLGY